jgi:hypothetical protein
MMNTYSDPGADPSESVFGPSGQGTGRLAPPSTSVQDALESVIRERS